jgi:hypothetical protein
MDHPFGSDEDMAAIASAMQDEAHDDELLTWVDEVSEQDDEDNGRSVIAATGITSHVLACGSLLVRDKSTYKPPWTTDAVWTRVAFFNRAGARMVLSSWRNLGPGNPYVTYPFTWTYNAAGVARALVVWNSNSTNWNSWANC